MNDGIICFVLDMSRIDINYMHSKKESAHWAVKSTAQ